MHLPLIEKPSATLGNRRPGFLRLLGLALLLLASATDVLLAGMDGRPPWLQAAVVLPAGLAALLWPAKRGSPALSSRQRGEAAWRGTTVRATVPPVLSLALTVIGALSGWTVTYGVGEIVILLCLLLVSVRTCPAPWAAVCGSLNGVAVLALTGRNSSGDLMLTFAVLVGAAAGLGGYLRTLDLRRAVAVTETRRAERLAMAADLHDFVAHHVTGILVQAQLAEMLATTEPDRLAPIMKDIERASAEALASMRRTVGLLRDAPNDDATGPVPAERRPIGDLPALAGLVEDFGGPAGPKAVLCRAADVPDDLPHEVQAAAYRVVQEALTNVRRHAADATEVAVELAHQDHALRVTVRDDGRGGTRVPHAARGGGFGLVGLTERVTALGGDLRTGPRPDHGWEVTAVLPTVA
ncbi:sensor histidine kinase [Streptomyces sp. TRM68416]|uniref:sensor histidine kinase n=1 Tax=Streptomyces sp. TRM68416 TaxID=2758412 RepID=UPI002948BF2A|nr:sensor histidine kinase [Streptomyces sp. TRM68416]